MIVTRQRRRAFPWKRLMLPLVAIALVAFALWWGPSRNVIANGPAAPIWRAAGSAFGGVTAPFHVAAQNQQLTERNKQVAQLQQQVSQLQAANQTATKQLDQAQMQLAQSQTAPAHAAAGRTASSLSATAASATSGAGASSATGTSASATASPGVTSGDLSADATPDMRRAAQYWANMEPENAARVVQRLPVLYVARVFSLMSPDAASAIMDALPPKYAAELTQEHPQLGR